ncbi:GNAT family N-acetyltransferase [Candidatus Gracilibacteria bacterium]|nr:GNAT family N-acetyltransferase [Candidatus Gracilibacteria bacterium]NUJ98783.1 GNAT family N-acetyltransferase [Candidatus Gracilibacteria bacterium]
MLRLEFPNISHKDSYERLIKEWGKFEKTPSSPSKLFVGKDFEDFLERVISDITHNEKGVNSHLFFLIDDSEILGGIQIRHHINHPNLIELGGHIGYGIAPKYRKKGYATVMLQLGLEEAKKLGLKKVLLTCDIGNIGSNKVIQKNGGVFERKTNDGAKNRYWIEIKK